MKIIIDACGGDHAPLEILKGACKAREQYGYDLVLVGPEEDLKRLAKEQNLSTDGIQWVDVAQGMPMEAHPKSILREHKNCSMAVALQLLHDGQGDAMISAGSTGALLMGATFIVKRIKGVSRPALAPILPSDNKPFMLIDSGATTDCRPEMLVQFAQMGSIYMSHQFSLPDGPRVGLLNVGTEETKGGELQHATFPLLQESGLNFIGNIEARDVPSGVADVVVADGFSGNVLLKTMEGTADMILRNLKQVFTASLPAKLGAMLVLPGIQKLKSKLSTSEYGGAVLLGVQKPVVKAHGNTKEKSFASAIRIAAQFAEDGIIEEIASSVTSKTEESEE